MKNKILTDLKDLILTLRDKPNELKDKAFRDLWLQKLENVRKSVSALNPEDKKAVDQEMQIWSAAEKILDIGK